MNNDQNKYEYSYTAPTPERRKTVENIKSGYIEPTPKTDYDELVELDKKVKNPPMIIALALGVLGCLIFGLGLTFVLQWNKLVLGIALMLVGCAPMLIAYPVYQKVLAHGKKKYAERILELSNRILAQN